MSGEAATAGPIETLVLGPAGAVPNNARLPLVLYRAALAGGGTHAFLARFAANGWGGAWVDGIYGFQHYHSTAHEVLGIAQGRARVQFGGPEGPIVEVAAGDAVVLPAGVAHCLIEASRLTVVGAYPAGQESPDLMRPEPATRAVAEARIARVALPACDPIHGAGGALVELWARAGA